MSENPKIKTYLGFALRARKVALGVGAAKATRERVYLLVMDVGTSENTKKEIEKLRARFSCPLVVVEDLEGLTGKAYCKLAAIKDEHLALAILNEIQSEE